MIINPSTAGWFDKFLNNFLLKEEMFKDIPSFYQFFQTNGFVYGKIVSKDYQLDEFQLTDEEFYKLCYVKALYHLDKMHFQDEAFIKRLIVFYKNTVSEKWLSFDQFFVKENSTLKLETIIHNRINFYHHFSDSKYVQNVLIFLDILLYYRFLKGEKISLHTLHFLEKSVEGILTAVDLKPKGFTLDEIFKPFINFFKEQNLESKGSVVEVNLTDLGTYFFVDLAIINHYIQHKNLDDIENIMKFGELLGQDKQCITLAVFKFVNFVYEHAQVYKLFEKQAFHEAILQNTQNQFFLLLDRNKKRLSNEINNNKKLFSILSQTPFKNLNKDERQYVKNQLLEICKTIPSLAIFVLPGGGIFLPILLRFLPQLLPNSFNENKNLT